MYPSIPVLFIGNMDVEGTGGGEAANHVCSTPLKKRKLARPTNYDSAPFLLNYVWPMSNTFVFDMFDRRLLFSATVHWPIAQVRTFNFRSMRVSGLYVLSHTTTEIKSFHSNRSSYSTSGCVQISTTLLYTRSNVVWPVDALAGEDGAPFFHGDVEVALDLVVVHLADTETEGCGIQGLEQNLSRKGLDPWDRVKPKMAFWFSWKAKVKRQFANIWNFRDNVGFSNFLQNVNENFHVHKHLVKICNFREIYVFKHWRAVLSLLTFPDRPVFSVLAERDLSGRHVRASQSRLPCSSCPVPDVLFRLSRHGCPATFILSQLPRPSCPVFAIKFLTSCPLSPVLDILSFLSSLVVLSQLSILSCPALAFLFPVAAVLSLLLWPSCPVLYVPSMLTFEADLSRLTCPVSCPRCFIPTFLAWHPPPPTLSWLSHSGCPVQAVPSLLSCHFHPVLPVISRLTYPGIPVKPAIPNLLVRAVLSQLSCTVMDVLPRFSCPGCPFPAELFLLSCSGRPVISFLCWL